MALTALLLLLLLGTGTCTVAPTETTELTTETMTTESTTMETTTKATTKPHVATTPNITASKHTDGDKTPTSSTNHATIFPTSGNTTNYHTSNSSTGAAANSTTGPVYKSTDVSNATTNSSHWVSPSGSNATHNISIIPTTVMHNVTVIPTSATHNVSVIPTYLTESGTVVPSTKSNVSSRPQVHPTHKTSVTSHGTTGGPRQTPTVVQDNSDGPTPSKTVVLLPTAVQLLLRVPLSFRILNRNFSGSLRDPTSEEYRSLSHTVLVMFKTVFGCPSCVSRQTYKGCSELSFSQGSVKVQSTLMFGHGNNTITSNFAEEQLRNHLDKNGFIVDLQLADIQSSVETAASPGAEPTVPGWGIALLVLVCVLVLLSILSCLVLAVYACRRKSRGKLDLFSVKDSYHPMAEYPPYQSHGRYVSPNSKPNTYSQVAGSNNAGSFTYTNPSASSDNL